MSVHAVEPAPATGLTTEEASERLARFGPNSVVPEVKRTELRRSSAGCSPTR